MKKLRGCDGVEISFSLFQRVNTRPWCLGLAVCVVLFGTRAEAWAGDASLAFTGTVIDAPDAGAYLYFGMGLVGADFDEDGFADVAISEPGKNVVFVYPGSSLGPDMSAGREITAHTIIAGIDGTFGLGLGAFDGNGDGYADLAVGDNSGSHSYVVVFSGGPSGLSEASEFALPVPPADSDAFFGQELSGAGDTNGDGFEELVVADYAWAKGAEDMADSHDGALFLYSGSMAGVDPCPQVLRVTVATDTRTTLLGERAAAGGDVNGDGYSDVVTTCAGCADDGHHLLVYWLGDALDLKGPYYADDDVCCNVAMIGDIDGDGFDEIAEVGSGGGTKVFYGSPSGLDVSHSRAIPSFASDAAAAGDLDGDGFDDVILGDEYRYSVGIVYGSADRSDNPAWVELPTPDWADFWGHDVFGSADINGDGMPEVVSADYYANGLQGSVTVFSPTCTWYSDLDGDGAGDPLVSETTCHDPGSGWAPRPNDCDDGDAAVQGARWFPDADGDGYGSSLGQTLACIAPTGAIAQAFDCDDHDGARSPALADATADGIDQDCDGHDGAWLFDTGDCPEDTGADTGDTAGDSARETGADTGDSAADTADSGDTAKEDSAPSEDYPGESDPSEPACGCAASQNPPESSACAAGLLTLLAVRASRRGPITL